MTRIDILDSVRGLLSWWVALAHIFMMINIFNLPKILNPAYAVDVFIILSGFVITLLLVEKKETYFIFILRRGFRLLPVYVLLLIISALFINEQISLLSLAPFESHYIDSRIINLKNTVDNFWTNFFLHLTLLHGVVGSGILPSSDYAFIEPAWSLSLEWQFYLVAPIIITLMQNANKSLWIIVLSIVIASLYGKGGDGLLANDAHYFFVGIVSYYIYRNINIFDSSLYVATMLISFSIIMRSIPLIVWAIVFSSVTNENTKYGNIIFELLNHRILKYFGKISFPIYIVHSLVMHFSLGIPYFLDKNQVPYSFFILFVSISITWGVSHLLHILIEQPGINVGRRISRFLIK